MTAPSRAESGSEQLLARLLELYFDLIEACGTALERLQDTQNRQLCSRILADYERSARQLTAFLLEAGDSPPTKGDARGVLAVGKVAIAEIAGDRGMLGALLSNEKGLASALEKALASDTLKAPLTEDLKTELAAATAHLRAWDERLEELRDAAHVRS